MCIRDRWSLVMLFPGLFVRMFSSDAALFSVAVPALRVYICLLYTSRCV